MISPHIDYSWVPDDLRRFVAGMLATLLIVAVICFVLAVVWWLAAKVSGNFFVQNGRGGMAIISVVIASVLVVSLPAGVLWGTSINPTPRGMATNGAPASAYGSQYGANSPLAKKYGADAAQSLGSAQQHQQQGQQALKDAGKKLRNGDVLGAAGAAIDAGKNGMQSTLDNLKAGVQAMNHKGFGNVLRDGWNAITNKAVHTFGGR
ncbi:hypothetical protein [Bifidobacterium mongoliense]|uniref:hypothetical protein n=1 Tax=Bifidobacterium mongoliense TaxID=518643 RepID=UPI0030EF7F93